MSFVNRSAITRIIVIFLKLFEIFLKFFFQFFELEVLMIIVCEGEFFL